jgi:hypothetical protein
MTVRNAHCAKNRSGKDQLYSDEILQIRDVHFPTNNRSLCSIQEFREVGDSYDNLIVGWTKYWNEVLQTTEPLEPIVVKALIASESGFRPKVLASKRNSNSARGLMQLTNSTRKILGDEKGELKDHFITVTRSDLDDPNINICSGVRWLFQKRTLASNKRRKEATWEDAVFEYKGLSTEKSEERRRDLINRFHKYYTELKECKNQ